MARPFAGVLATCLFLLHPATLYGAHRATSWLIYAVGFVAAAQIIGLDIAPLVAVGKWPS